MTNKASQHPRFMALFPCLGKRSESLRIAVFSGLYGKSSLFLATVGLLVCCISCSNRFPVRTDVFFGPHSLTGLAVPDWNYGTLPNDIGVSLVGMPSPAMSSGTLAFGTPTHVYGWRDWLQMGRIATRPIATQVIQLHALCNRAISQDVGHTVSAISGQRLRPVLHGAPVKVPIPIFSNDPNPNPTSGLRNLAPALDYGQQVFDFGSLSHGASIRVMITRHA